MAAAVIFRLWSRAAHGARAAMLVGLAVFSHWVLDFVVHRPDLPLYDDTMKVGLGLWNRPVIAFLLEAGLLLGSLALYLGGRTRGHWTLIGFALAMLGIQALVFFGPPPSGRAAAVTALVSYAVFAGVIAWWERRFA